LSLDRPIRKCFQVAGGYVNEDVAYSGWRKTQQHTLPHAALSTCHPTPLSSDCCDGTDELSGCKNTCIEKNSAKRDAIQKEIADYQAALDRKGQYASSASGVRENIKQRFANVDSDLEQAEKELERLKGKAMTKQPLNDLADGLHQYDAWPGSSATLATRTSPT
jgi:hypothetical protein